MSNSAPDNKIADESAVVEEGAAPIEWDNIAIAVPFDMKTDLITVSRKSRARNLSEWGRKILAAALEEAGYPHWAEEERRREAEKNRRETESAA